METDPEFAKRAKKAMSLLRTELLKALRKQEKFDEALKQVDQLIKENPNALEPLMEKGRILEAWAEKDPAKFDDGRGPLGHAAQPAARDAEEAGRVLRSDVQRRQVSGARGRKEQGQGKGRRLCEEGRAGAQVAHDPQSQAQRPRHGGQVQSAAEQGD